jgi:hypothetical protein
MADIMDPPKIKIIVDALFVVLIIIVLLVLAKRYQVRKRKIKELRKEQEVLNKKYKEIGKLLRPQREEPILHNYDDINSSR